MASRKKWPTRSPSSPARGANTSADRSFGSTAARRCFPVEEWPSTTSGGLKVTDGKRFEGTTAVVTGGGSGIGLEFARRFVAEGGRVTLWDNDPGRLKAATAELGDKSRVERVDVVNAADVERATEASHAAMGQIDALVCSAGVAGLNAPVIDYPIDEWKRVFDIDVHGLFYCNRFVARLMKARGYGRIVNISS